MHELDIQRRHGRRLPFHARRAARRRSSPWRSWSATSPTPTVPAATSPWSASIAEQRAGKFATTSQINPLVYRKAFEKALKNGQDVLYLCFSSGLSGTIERARHRELADTPSASSVCGFRAQFCEALKKQAEGMGFEEMVAWLEENRLHVCHWFTVDTFDHLRHGGRVSGAVAPHGPADQAASARGRDGAFAGDGQAARPPQGH